MTLCVVCIRCLYSEQGFIFYLICLKLFGIYIMQMLAEQSAASFMPVLQLSQFLQIVWLHKNINSKQNVALLI